MKKVLLSLAALTAGMTAQAQVLDYGFEEGQSATIDSANWMAAYPTSSFNIVGGADVPRTGDKALSVHAEGTANRWERVVAFKNLTTQEDKSYRVSFWAKGTGKINVAMMQGDWNADMPLVAGNGETSVEQIYEAEVNDPDYKRVSFVYWRPTEAIQNKFYASGNHANPKAEGEFLRLSFVGEGDYLVDDIIIEESSVKNITANGSAIIVDFGYATNAAKLAEEAGGTLILPSSCVNVEIDGNVADIESVEIKSDGKFIIYVDSENYLIEADTEVKVSFTNPGDLKYSSNVAPECFTNPNCAVYNFENEIAYFDEAMEIPEQLAYEEASLVSSVPQDNSFEWLGDLNEFSFTFNKPVWAEDSENGEPIATLSGQGIEETLEIVKFDGTNATLTFKRPAGAAELANGEYTITLDNVCNEMHVATTTPFEVSFEVGLVTVGTVEYTDVSSVWMEGEYNTAQPTNGWISYFNGEENSSNANRVGNMVTKDKGVGFYFCQRDGSVAAKLTYGEKEDAPLTLPAGDVQITVYFTKWQGNGGAISYKLAKKANPDEAVASGSLVAEGNTGNFGETVTSIPGAEIKLPDTEAGEYILTLEVSTAWNGCIVYGFDVKTYKSIGLLPDPEIVINETFASVEANAVPAAGSGWAVYESNNLLAKGQNQSGHTRMMSISNCSGLTIGFYNRCFGDAATYYMTYGEPAPEGQEEAEPELILENAKYSFSWYAVNWKGDEQTYYFQLINAETNQVEYEMKPVKVTANVNGNQQAATAEQILFNYTPQGGKYIMKWWMTGESVIGNIRVEKMGSIAVYWKNRLNNDGLKKAKEERENAADDEFAGTTRDNLDAVIAKNTNPVGYHTGEDYQKGIDECLAAAKAMSARRAAIAAFKTDIVKLADKLAEIDAKYENLEIIPALKDLVAKYAEVNPSTLEDEELLPVQAQITAGIDAITNVIDAVDKFYTKQIQNLLAGIYTYGESLDNEFALSWVEKGEKALTDDQAVADMLKLVLTGCLYDTIANGFDFSILDVETETSNPDSIDITGYIANNMFYTVNPQKTYQGSEANAAFPGWNILEGTVSNVWWWENTLAISANKPAVDASLRNTGGNAFKVCQELTNLPVGVYSMLMKTADCSNVADVSTTYTKKDEEKPWSESVVYANVKGYVTSTEANYGSGQVWRNASDTYLPGIQVLAPDNEITAYMTIGADMNCTGDAAQVDDTRLFMTGKIEGFDYKAAADAIFQRVKDGIQTVERTDAPIAVQYINLAGQKGAAQGINIRVEHYSDGYTVVRKVMVK